MANALRALIQWYRTGDDADRAKFDIAWVQDKASPVDTINGFIEVYLDARGIKGAWEGVVFYVNREKTARIQKLADNAQWFEDHMPWDPKYRKPNVQGIVANAIDVVVETGDSGPVTPIGINLPNDQAIREKYGSKSVALSNVTEGSNRATPGSMRSEFAWTPEETARADKFAEFAAELTTDMHEVIGHASGRMAPGITAIAAGADQGGVLGARRRPGRSRRPLLHRRSEAGRDWHDSRRRSRRHCPRRVRGLHAQCPGPAASRP